MTYVIAFDFESFGPIPTIHGFTQLGAVIGSLTDGTIIDTFCKYANQSKYIKDEECIRTFWLKHPERYQETLEKCAKSKKQPQEVVEKFVKWITDFVETRKTEGIYLITDCTAYDAGILKTFSLCSTLKIINKNNVRDIIDTTSYYLGISRLFMTEEIVDGDSFELARKALNLPVFTPLKTIDEALKGIKVEHDHNPVNDATLIFKKFKYINDGLLN